MRLPGLWSRRHGEMAPGVDTEADARLLIEQFLSSLWKPSPGCPRKAQAEDLLLSSPGIGSKQKGYIGSKQTGAHWT